MRDTVVLQAYTHINEKRIRPWKGEEEVRIAWVSALEIALGIHLNAERSRMDSSYNNVIIEFKAPNYFKGSKNSAKFKEATEQRLLPYIKSEALKTGIPEDDFIGIAIDGEHICFAQVKNGLIETQHLIPFSEYAVGLVIQAIQAQTRRAVSVDNLLYNFGHGSTNAKALMQALSDALVFEISDSGSIKIKMLFEEWKALYGQVADMSILQAEAVNREIGFLWNGNKEHSMSGRLFVIHTYNSLLIKLLAAEIVSAYGLTSIKQPAQEMAAILGDSSLLDYLENNIEKAEIFSFAGINGFIEEVIFSWYLDVARQEKFSENILQPLRSILSSLSLYRTDHLTHTRDVLRDLYQGLVPSKLRQSLGEFYTPDWLVDFAIERTPNKNWLKQRVLDPTCGSGAFILAAMKRIRKEASAAGWNAKQTVQYLCSSVWGFDLNPLAVQTARVNFLMEIADLLKEAEGQSIEIPVLLADAIYSPAPNPDDNQGIVKYQIGSQIAGLDITLPVPLAFDRLRLDDIFAQMGECIESDFEYLDAEETLLNIGLITKAEADEWREPLQYTYNQILELHRKQWNGIWFRIVRNFFWSATAGHFDYIIGNPPWVRWSKLPEAYRERVKPTCEHYGIFSNNKRHGGNELDISAMITYTVADKWLKDDGRLVFVITGTVFKSPSSSGFRTFQLEPSNPQSAYLSPVSIDDMKNIKPFADASNHTAVAVFDKTKEAGSYPVPYCLWNSKAGIPKAIPAQASLDDVMQWIEPSFREAHPVDGIGSPWAVLKEGRYSLLQNIAGESVWFEGRKGITTDLNGVYFVPITNLSDSKVQIRSRPEAGKKDIGQSKTAWIEPDLLYPLLKGAGDIDACYLKIQNPTGNDEVLYTFVPNKGINKEEYANSELLMNSPLLKKTKEWFSSYKKLLLERSTYRRQMKGAPFFAIYNVGDYTLKPWKVVWPEMSSRFYAAVVGSAEVPLVGMRPYIPDHKIYYTAFDQENEAYYLCGLLNTSVVTEWIESHTIKIQVANIFKHTNLPAYNPNDASHTSIAQLVKNAHKTHDANERALIIEHISSLGEKILLHWKPSK